MGFMSNLDSSTTTGDHTESQSLELRAVSLLEDLCGAVLDIKTYILEGQHTKEIVCECVGLDVLGKVSAALPFFDFSTISSGALDM